MTQSAEGARVDIHVLRLNDLIDRPSSRSDVDANRMIVVQELSIEHAIGSRGTPAKRADVVMTRFQSECRNAVW